MEFEWDEFKNQANIRKHGVSFDAVQRIFEGPILTRQDLRRDYGEERCISIGRAGSVVLIVVDHTLRNGRTRPISARPACRKERKAYRESIRKTAHTRSNRGHEGR